MKLKMKKVVMMHSHHFFLDGPSEQVYPFVGVARAAGAACV
jgi:hypothetical protein